MISKILQPAAVLTAFALVSSSALYADSFERESDGKHASSRPSVTTYATGLTNPRGLAFGPDGNLYVAEAGTGGATDASRHRTRLSGQRQHLQPFHGRLQRSRDPRAAKRHEGDGGRQSSEHDPTSLEAASGRPTWRS